ncbi:hypothetical protein Bbelb_423140, partial [Branchiostoma belcheri]
MQESFSRVCPLQRDGEPEIRVPLGGRLVKGATDSDRRTDGVAGRKRSNSAAKAMMGTRINAGRKCYFGFVCGFVCLFVLTKYVDITRVGVIRQNDSRGVMSLAASPTLQDSPVNFPDIWCGLDSSVVEHRRPIVPGDDICLCNTAGYNMTRQVRY